MDVELLSRIIRELIIDHDEVALPQVGTFVAELVPASFSDRGYMVNPPYRRLSFVQRPGSDTLLVDFYAKANGMDLRMAESYLGDFLSELRKVLEERKVIVLPGLGRLRATRENALFFVPEEDLDIYPDGFGLKSVSLKHIPSEQEAVEIPVSFVNAVAGTGRHVSAEPESVEARPVKPESAELESTEPESSEASSEKPESAEAVPERIEASSPDAGPALAEMVPAGPLPDKTAGPVSAGLPSDADAVQAAETETVAVAGVGTEAAIGTGTEAEAKAKAEAEAEAEEPAQPSSGGRRKTLKAVLIALGTCVAVAGLLLAVFLILADVAPDFIDSILYTPEELRIINY
ncbi:MAG: hypothetical protein BHV78_04675 [Bacteroides sp. CAG:1060_57_27]|nr:MAG: hypothetical protein BHV78_04675 [Bacteroides sp. CAG:1060_57_27]